MFRIPDRKFSSTLSDQPISIGQNCWVSCGMPFTIDNEWRKWLGGIISDRMENGPGKIVLTAKSQNPDESSEALINRISLVFWGLTIMSGIPDFSSGDQVHGHFQHDRSVQTGIKIGFGMRRLYPTYAPNDPLTGPPILEIPESGRGKGRGSPSPSRQKRKRSGRRSGRPSRRRGLRSTQIGPSGESSGAWRQL